MDQPLPKVLGVIGARAGSRMIPHKNIRPLVGKPLFLWIADAAKSSPRVTRLMMSTDSPEYADIAKQHGIEVPFLRPQEFATDATPDFDYLYHAATWLKEHEDWQADIILRLPPTTPLCRTSHIDACVDLLTADPSATSSRTVTAASKHPYKLWRTDGEYLAPFLSEEFTGMKDAHNMPRQSFPPAFQHVDVIALRWTTLVDQKSMAGSRVRYHVIPKEDAIDIDTENDFSLAEIILKKRSGERR